MKKRVLTMFLTLVLCMGVSVPAFAADDDMPSAEDVLSLINLSVVDYDFDYYVQEQVTLYYTTEDSEEVLSFDGCNLIEHNALLNVENIADVGENCSVTVTLQVFHDQDGRFVSTVPEDYYYLTRDGGFVSVSLDPESYGGMLKIAPGDSATFSLSDDSFPSDSFFVVRTMVYYPDYNYTWWKMCSFFVDDEAAARMRQEQSEAPAFTDVPDGEWYADSVAWAVKKGITNGTTNTTFSPNQDCTHAQILTFLHRAAGNPPADAECPVAVADAYADAVNWAYGKGMIDDGFDPGAPCTRSQAVLYIWQALDEPPAQPSSFADVDAGAPYAKAVDWAVEKGVTNGDGGADTFSPDKVCSRGHIVTFLYRAYNG